ncbi:MAG: uracil-DNA glycosylase [Terriglobales bacterium]
MKARPDSLERVDLDVEHCRQCPRLVAYGATVARERRRAFADQTYWARPVAGFGDPAARVLLVGLAPAAHGAHRTGRMFTGDRSGDFLFAALHRAGLASAPESRHRDDGLRLRGVYLTASARCAPPDNRPSPAEFARCRPFLLRELALLPGVRVIVALGRLAHQQLLLGLGLRAALFAFAHGREHDLGRWHLLDCYHPSQQNTFTGRLTPAMLDAVLQQARALAELRTESGGKARRLTAAGPRQRPK